LYVALNVECAPFSITSVTSVGYCCRSAIDDDEDEGFGEEEPSEGEASGEDDDECDENSTRNLTDLAGPTDDESGGERSCQCRQAVSQGRNG
jgi:hypothetical protein